jgi:hypothetical protein
MNTICIGVPVVVAIYFLVIGITMAVELRKIIDSYNLLSKTLEQLSALWKPEDPLSYENNQMLFNIVKSLLGQSLRISSLARRDTFGWTVVSISMISVAISAYLSIFRNSIVLKKLILFFVFFL